MFWLDIEIFEQKIYFVG